MLLRFWYILLLTKEEPANFVVMLLQSMPVGGDVVVKDAQSAAKIVTKLDIVHAHKALVKFSR